MKFVAMSVALAAVLSSANPIVYPGHPGGYGGPIPLGFPTSAGTSQQSMFDNTRQGFDTNTNSAMNQADTNNQVQSYDRANTAQQVGQTSSIAQGFLDGYQGTGAGSIGSAQKAFTNNFDRGSLVANQNHGAFKNTDANKHALNVGSVAANQKSTTTLGPFSSGFGVADQTKTLHQEAGDNAHLDEGVADQASRTEQFDRGATKKVANSAASIAQGGGFDFAGPYGGVGSEGANEAMLANTRDRGFSQSTAAQEATNVANVANLNVNDVNSVKAKKQSAAIGPYGSVGAIDATAGLDTSQRAYHHDDQGQSALSQLSNTKQLDSEWNQAAQAQNVAIGNGLAGPGVSKGASMASSVNGHDRSYAQDNALSAAQKSGSSTSNAFDDRSSRQTLQSNAAIGGAPIGFPVGGPGPW